jgi:Xaa-Pro aminopeptidase
MRADRLDAFVVTHLPNILYLTGFSGSSGTVLVTRKGAILFTDPRYTIQAKQEVTAAQVKIVRGSLLRAVGQQLERRAGRRVGFEAAHLTVLQKAALGKSTAARIRWIPRDGKVEGLRVVKDESELVTMREAAQIACSSWEETLPLVKPGVSEIELAAEIEFRMRRKGADGPAFDTIIASGERGAWPHARASRKLVKKNELVVFDLGAILRGYSSDLTRTVCVGRASLEMRRWYAAVLEAQQAARQALRPGITAEQVDAAARDVLKQAGLERRFIHSTGHGLGLEVHERPRLGRGDQSILRAGTVVTLEPGVYIEGTGGIRIEDDALVTNAGAEFLTHANRELIEIG